MRKLGWYKLRAKYKNHSDRKNMNKPLTFLVLGLSVIHPATNAVDWALMYGVHDTFVRDENSDTLGADIGIAVSAITDSGIMMDGSLTLFGDYDHDELDPDYSPYWHKADAQIKRELYQLTPTIGLDWLARFDGKQNTVSAVEKQSKLFAGIGAHYETSTFNLGLKAFVGYYNLEIDDDVPQTRGYPTDDLKYDATAYSVLADGQIKLNTKTLGYIRLQQYRDNNQWLENQCELTVSYDSTEWIKGSTLYMSSEYTKYNLGPYHKEGLASVLPWDSDTLFRIYMKVPWRE